MIREFIRRTLARSQAEPEFNSIPRWFAETEMGQQVISEASADRYAERLKLFNEKHDRIAEYERAAKPLVRELEEARSEAEAANAAWRQAKDRRDQAERALYGASVARDSAIGNLDAELRRTAPPVLRAARDELRAEWQRARTFGAEVVSYGERPLGGSYPQVSNRPSIVGHMDGLRAAASAIEDLMLNPLEEADLLVAIEEILADVPEIEGAAAFLPPGAKPAGLLPDDADDEGSRRRGSWAHDGALPR